MNLKKTLAVGVLALAALLAAPAAAVAEPSPPPYGGTAGSVTGSISPSTVVPGQTATATFTFTGDAAQNAAVTITTSGGLNFAILRAATTTIPAVNGVAQASVVANAPGTYTIDASAVGLSSRVVLTVVAAADSGGGTSDGLSGTGFDVPVAVILGAGGLLVLGAALVIAFTRRSRSGA